MGHRPEPPEPQGVIVNRLRSAEGHLHAILSMVEAGAPCEEVLHQLDAVEAALGATGRAVRYCQFMRSVETILHGPNAEARITEVERIAALYGLQVRPVTFSSKRIPK